MDVKLWLLVREDLQMSKGKIAAQCCHACLQACRGSDQRLLRRWKTTGEAIVVLSVDDLPHMQEVEELCLAKDTKTHIVVDAGRTEVNPGTKTVMAVGPQIEARIRPILENLRLVK